MVVVVVVGQVARRVLSSSSGRIRATGCRFTHLMQKQQVLEKVLDAENLKPYAAISDKHGPYHKRQGRDPAY